MSFFYPHTVTVRKVSQAAGVGTNLAENPTLGDSATVSCDVQGKTPKQIYDRFGIETSQPALLYCATADVTDFEANAEVTFGDLIYSVVGDPMTRDDGTALAYGLVVLDLKHRSYV